MELDALKGLATGCGAIFFETRVLLLKQHKDFIFGTYCRFILKFFLFDFSSEMYLYLKNLLAKIDLKTEFLRSIFAENVVRILWVTYFPFERTCSIKLLSFQKCVKLEIRSLTSYWKIAFCSWVVGNSVVDFFSLFQQTTPNRKQMLSVRLFFLVNEYRILSLRHTTFSSKLYSFSSL